MVFQNKAPKTCANKTDRWAPLENDRVEPAYSERR